MRPPSATSSALASAVVLLVVAAACGGGGSGGSSDGGCRSEGDALHLTARNTAFDVTCLRVAPDTAFTIEFENHDPGVAHSVSVYSSDPSVDSSARRLFAGDVLPGPGRTVYDVPALPAGSHFFRCEVHPAQMSGTFLVEG